jgi:hypothetical protein
MEIAVVTPLLVYCADGNRRYAEIAIEHGFAYGAQPLKTFYFPIDFADVDPNNMPARADYINALAEHRPRIASVMDWTAEIELSEVLAWAEDAAAFVEVVLIIPKVHGGIARLPRRIGSAEVRLGYSVPTRHGGTEVFVGEFAGWPVHLLGGSPGQQMRLSRYMDVRSVDGNMANRMANLHCAFWRPGKRPYANAWPSLKQARGGELWGDGTDQAGATYEAFRRSCANIMAAWAATEAAAG